MRKNGNAGNHSNHFLNFFVYLMKKNHSMKECFSTFQHFWVSVGGCLSLIEV
jgi:hypothetical protein